MQIVGRMLPLAGVPRHVDVPPSEGARGQHEAEHAPLPGGVEDGLLRFGLRVYRPQAVNAPKVVSPVHAPTPAAMGAPTVSTPIMAFRPTSAASSSSLMPSVPSGRWGSTR